MTDYAPTPVLVIDDVAHVALPSDYMVGWYWPACHGGDVGAVRPYAEDIFADTLDYGYVKAARELTDCGREECFGVACTICGERLAAADHVHGCPNRCTECGAPGKPETLDGSGRCAECRT